MRIVAPIPQYGGPIIAKNPIFLKNGKYHPKRKNSKTSRDMPKLAIYPSTIGKQGFQHVLYSKISKKTNFFCAAILDNFQTKMFKSETTSFHYFPQGFRISKILDIQLREVGAKRRLNGTSKVNRRTHGHTDRHTDILTYKKHRHREPML